MFSYRQAATILGVDRKALPALAKVAGIKSRRHKSKPNANGLTERDMAKLKKLLGIEGRSGSSSAVA